MSSDPSLSITRRRRPWARASATVLFPAMTTPCRSISTARPAPNACRECRSASRPRGVPRFALRGSDVRSDSVRMSVAGVGRFVISAPPLDPRSVAAAPDPTISGPAVGRATAHHGRALRRFSETKRCTKMREGTSRGHSGPDHVADVLASLHCAHEAIGESAPPLVQHPGDLAGSSRLCEPAETTPLARAERAAHSATADPEDTRRHFGVRHHGELVVRGVVARFEN